MIFAMIIYPSAFSMTILPILTILPIFQNKDVEMEEAKGGNDAELKEEPKKEEKVEKVSQFVLFYGLTTL